MDNSTVALLIGVLIVAMRVIEALVKKFGNGNKSSMTLREHEWLKGLFDMHNRMDTNGRPIWYVPQSIADTSDRIVEVLREQSAMMGRQTTILEGIAKSQDTVLERVRELKDS